MLNLLTILFLLSLSGCSLLIPQSGTHYAVKYGEIEVEVDDYSDREGLVFNYVTPEGTKIMLKKDSVDTATPAAVIAEKSIENQAVALELLNKVVK